MKLNIPEHKFTYKFDPQKVLEKYSDDWLETVMYWAEDWYPGDTHTIEILKGEFIVDKISYDGYGVLDLENPPCDDCGCEFDLSNR